MSGRLNWAPIIERAAEIVRSYDIAVTLRQLFYRCVSAELLPNTQGAYKSLSSHTADLRRNGEFPALYDRGRNILQATYFAGPAHAVRSLLGWYRLDRTAGQDHQVWLGVEKNALAGLMEEWFDDYGVPVLPLGGYSSESIDREVRQQVERDGRPAVLIYAGDFDASGMDIGRNFIDQTDCWDHTLRVSLSEQQIEDMSLPVLEGKPLDARAPGFIAAHPVIHARHNFGFVTHKSKRYRIPVQVELDAVDPQILHDLYEDALLRFWDDNAHQDVLDQEDADKSVLTRLGDAS